MADFTADFHSLMYTTMESTPQFPALNPKFFHNSMNFHNFPLSNELFCGQNPELSGGIFPESKEIEQPTLSAGNEFHEKRKRMACDEVETSSAISTPQVSENGIKRKKSSGRGRRVKAIDREEEKSGEIVHVRARRGQATDSHSLAERVRRGKINERLRSLQDIVPGCYKSMGMAVMLDEIINYVQSLQNQVEFLSMKLAAASSMNEFSLETIALENFQRAKAEEAKELEKLIREGYGTLACFQSTWPF